MVMKRVLCMICVVAVFLCFPFRTEAEEWDGLVYNGDFSEYSESADMPAGWQLVSYDATLSEAWVTTDASGQNGICLCSYGTNDVRACQDISVTPDTTYHICAEICTDGVESGQGANLSVDNYSIDGTFCYTEPILGTNDWTPVDLFVHTGSSQDVLRIALRLGGYGKTSSGLAGFRDVSVAESEYMGEDVIFLTETVSADKGHEDNGETNGLYGVIAAFIVTALLSVVAYRLITSGRTEEGNETEERYGTLALILAFAFIVRLVLSLIFFGHSTDINCFMAWGNAALNGGLSNFYTSGMFADYPPGYMYFCALMSWLSRLLGFGYGSAGMAFLFKLPSTLADIATAFLLYRLARKNGLNDRTSLILAALMAFDPVIAFVSGAWGQIESLLVLGIAASCYLLQENRPITAGAVYGLTILLKPQALMFGPILAVSYFCAVRYARKPMKQLIKTVLSVIAAFAVIFIVSLPFRGTQKGLWLADKYFSTSVSYPYASIEAFNFPALLGDNWASVYDKVLGLPYTVWGPVMIGIGVLFASVLHVCSYMSRTKERNGDACTLRRGSLYLSAACMMAFLFTFGYYMHERYLIPVLLLLLIAFVYEKDRRILAAFFGFSAASLFNATAAMYIVDHTELRGTLYEGITRCGGFFETLCCLYLIWICVDILLFDHKKEGAHPLKFRETKKKDDRTDDKTHVRGADILQLTDGDNARCLSGKDRFCMIALTLVYAVCALLNLGSLSAPETYWETGTTGDSLTVSFGEKCDVASCFIFGNIAESGTILFESDDGESILYEQKYDNMFRWDETDLSLQTEQITVSLYAGSVKINEIAFFDGNGDLLRPEITVASPGAEKLLDEQDTVPERPSYFNGMYFDELYHARTAYEHLHNMIPYENSHPPLGKIIISVGIALFGMNPFGWRIMGTLFGIAMLPVMYLFGKRMFKDTAFASVCTGLFAFDFMHFTQTRIATIDVYAVFFILLMYYFMYEYITMNFFTDGLKRTLRPLALCGVSFGLGCACKWISAYAGVGLAVLFFGSLFTRWGEYVSATKNVKTAGACEHILLRLTGHLHDREATKREKTLVAVFPQYALLTIGWCCLFFLLIPFTIYFASYIPYFRYEASIQGSYTLSDAFDTFGRYQAFMFNYHSKLTATHPYQSSWWQWPFTLRPMWYYSGSDYDNGIISTLTASGNPAVWWISSVGAAVLLAGRVAGRIRKDKALEIFAVGILANFLPWVLVTRCTFIYHFFATVPFILMATVYLVKEIEREHPEIKAVKWIWLGVAVLMFILLYPGISGLPIDATWAAFIKRLPGGGLMYGA